MSLLGGVRQLLRSRDNSFSRTFAGAADSLLASFLDYEKEGVPAGAGKAGQHGFDLDQMQHLLTAMEEPQKRVKVVHIAGTKGKGSTASMLSSILAHSGLKVGTYTSPHIHSINERIAINCQPIDSGAFDSLAERWKPAVMKTKGGSSKAALTHFEVLTALALAHFSEQQVDIAVIEAGLGGSQDATNIFESQQSLLAIITALSLEHQGALGETLQEIAAAKAGICKQAKPVLIGRQPILEAIRYLTEAATGFESRVLQASDIVRVGAGNITLEGGKALQQFVCKPTAADQDDLLGLEANSSLVGDHQAANAETAVAAAANLASQGFSQISKSSIKAGLESAVLPGRFQVSKLGPDKPWLVLDGAHTPASADALVKTIGQAFPEMPIGFIVAMANDKDHAGVLAALRRARPHVVTFMAVPIAGSSARSAPPGMLAGHWQAASFDEDVPLRCRELMKTNMASAMEATLRELYFADGNAVVCLTGSLHVISAAQDLET